MKPLIAAALFGILLMFASIFAKEKKTLSNFAIILLIILTGINIWELTEVVQAGVAEPLFHGMLRYDAFSLWFNTLISAITLLLVLLNARNIERVGNYVGEYYALIFFILVGVNLLASYDNMLILFLGIEIISIPQYILAGSDKKNLKSSEASLKYFLMGAFSTGFLLMGIALLYGAMGTFDITQFDFSKTGGVNAMALSGIIFIIVALGFKVSAAPMHFWAPDVYDGAPTPFTALMATIVKAAVFVGFMHLFKDSFYEISSFWIGVVVVVTALTLFIGNITAVFQQSVKRMLAYSSIAQAGFMLFAVLAINATGMKRIILYAVAYSVATIGMFAILAKLKDFTYDGFNGLAKKEPFVAFSACIFLFSLAGIPLTGGFFAKYYMLTAVMEQGGKLIWLVVFALLMAAVSVYYYFKVIMAMYFKKGDAVLAQEITFMDKLFLGISVLILIVMGFMPDLFLAWV
jgi:NADH-quinone oxidoreductase subunit N